MTAPPLNPIDPDVPNAAAPEAETKPPAPRGPAGLIGPTLVGMAIGVAVILVMLWLG